MAQLTKRADVSGRQMCHYSDAKRHYVAMSSVIATQFLHAGAVGDVAKYRDGAVVMLYRRRRDVGGGSTSR